jgi:hypothetical protein
LATPGFATPRRCPSRRIEERVEGYKKKLKNLDEDSKAAKDTNILLESQQRDLADRMSEIVVVGPIGAALLVLGVVLAAVGGKKKPA